MRITELLKNKTGPTISFETLPPKTPKGWESIDNTLDELALLNPDFITCTFGAGGKRRDGSLEMIQKIKHQRNQEMVAHISGFGLGPDEIISVMDNFKTAGIENILVIRGDVPEIEGFEPHPQSFNYATEMIDFIKPKYDFCIGAAAYPEGHIDANSLEKDMDYMQMKIDNGADYFICNYFYNNRYYFDFMERCAARNIQVPILAGVMPIYSVKMLYLLAEICGATVTDEIKEELAKIPADDQNALNEFGIKFATEKCTELIKSGVKGLHFYTMDRFISVKGILTELRKGGLLN